MSISVVHVVLALGGVVLAFLIFPYIRIIVHGLIWLGRAAVFALAAFVVLYASGVWRPDLSALLPLISRLREFVM